jgi:hypothetical protein
MSKGKSNKGMGRDGIPNEVWKQVSFYMKIFISYLFRKHSITYHMDGSRPDTWNQLTSAGIPKESMPQSTNAFRWVGLQDDLHKMYMGAICENMKVQCDKRPFVMTYGYKRRVWMTLCLLSLS